MSNDEYGSWFLCLFVVCLFVFVFVWRFAYEGVVVNVGRTTEIGKISAAIQSAKTMETPLQQKLARLGKWLVVVAFAACIVVVAIGLGT
jgi:Ca2+-transporting ATPase